jgi:oligopeptidase A
VSEAAPAPAADLAGNPFLACEAVPRFDRIIPAQVVPAVRHLIAALDRELERLETTLDAAPATWAAIVAPLTAASEPLSYAWGLVNHLTAVQDAPELRQAKEAVQPAVVQVFLRVGQSRAAYRALKRLQSTPAEPLDHVQQRILAIAVRNAELSGVGLEGAARARFQKIAEELAELSTRYSNNLLDATKAFHLDLTQPDEVAGLPKTLLTQAAHAAHAAAIAEAAAGSAEAGSETATAAPPPADPEHGPWRITLDFPSYGPFMEHSRRRDLRERLYRASITRASSGATDNLSLVERILRLRQEEARLLGFATFAEVSLATKMAPSVAAVEELLGDLRRAALPKATAELAELTAFARAQSGDATIELALWDVPFWAERLRETRYAYRDEDLRPYFAFERVLDGLFAASKRLFAIDVRPADGEVPVWDPSVRFFRIHDAADGRPLAEFFLDPYSRPANKRGGAWMDHALDRKRRADGSLLLPVAYLVCNQTPPVGAVPSLMTFREVETLFHEFGHGLQHMLTTVEHREAAGINNVEWDAVELPSQFMENWCYHRETVRALARHWQTGAELPDELFAKVTAARTFRAGSATLRQVYFSTLDLALHHDYRPDDAEDDDGVLAVQARIAAANTVLHPLDEDRFLCSFSHLFAGGYAAGYYSYKWAEVLSADAFGAFIEAGLDDPQTLQATGRRFRDTVLAQGGSRHPLEIFGDFRGRAPNAQALLRQCGLA